jgi:hypothetical protein
MIFIVNLVTVCGLWWVMYSIRIFTVLQGGSRKSYGLLNGNKIASYMVSAKVSLSEGERVKG